jgi:hypothetical protein
MTPPWGQKIRDGHKPIETRKWKTNYRGPILFVCALRPKSEEAGMALCTATLVDCRPMTKADEYYAGCVLYDGAWAWILRDVVAVEPFPVKGQLNLFETPDELIQPLVLEFRCYECCYSKFYEGMTEEQAWNDLEGRLGWRKLSDGRIFCSECK